MLKKGESKLSIVPIMVVGGGLCVCGGGGGGHDMCKYDVAFCDYAF